MLITLHMIFSLFAKTWMLNHRRAGSRSRLRLNFQIFNLDESGIILAKCEIVGRNPKFHGVTHRSKLDYSHRGSRYHAHIQKMLSKSPLATDFHHSDSLSNLLLIKFHILISLLQQTSFFNYILPSSCEET